MVLPRPRSAALALAAALLLIPFASALSLEPVAPARAASAPVEVPLSVQQPAWANDPAVALAPPKASLAPPGIAPPVGLPSGPASQDDCGTGTDAGYFTNGTSNATPIAFPADCAGTLGQNPAYDTNDIYQVDVPRWGTLEASLALPGASNGTKLGFCVGPLPFSYATDRCAYATPGAPARVATAQGPGPYFAWIYDSGSSPATYRLTLDLRDWTLGADCNGGDVGDTAADALLLQAPAACDAFLNPRDDPVDWYAIPVDGGHAVSLTMTPNAEADFDVCLYADPAGRPLDCSVLPMGQVDRVLLAPSQGGTYYLRVVQWDGAEGYTLSAQPAAAQDDCGVGGDGGSAYHAVALALPLACSGALDPAAGDHVDLFRVPLSQGGIRATLQGASAEGALRVCLYGPGESQPRVCGDETGVASVSVPYMSAQQGDWLVGVWALSPDAGAYTLDVAGFDPTPQDDCGSGVDAADAHAQPAPLVAPFACGGTLRLSEGDTLDRYRAALPPSSVALTFGSASPALDLCVSTPDVSRCYASDGGTVEIQLQALRAGNWTFSIVSKGHEDATYSLGVALGPAYDDCGTGGDAAGTGWSGATGSPLATPAACHGRLYVDSGDAFDGYALHVAHDGGALVVTLRSSAPVYVCVQPVGPGPTTCKLYVLGAVMQEFDEEGLAAGDYVVVLEASLGSSPIDYDLTANVV